MRPAATGSASSAPPARSARPCSRCSPSATSPPPRWSPFASERSAGKRVAVRRRRARVPAAHRRVDPGPRPRALLGRRRGQRRVGAAAGRGGRGGRRQHELLAHARRRSAGRPRGQPRRGRGPQRADRQPELLDDADDGRAGADPARGRDRAARRLHLPVGLRDRPARRSRSSATRRTRSSHGEEADGRGLSRTGSPSTSLPQVETFKDGDDYTTEERKVMAETRKILELGDDELGISATCARVPVFVGHSQSVNVQTREPLSPEECRELLAAAPGVAGRRRARRGHLPAGDRRRRPRRGARRADPPRPLARALPQPLGRRRQPAQGRGDERRPGRRGAPPSATWSASRPAPLR